jgi:thiol:disulfide interchange protein
VIATSAFLYRAQRLSAFLVRACSFLLMLLAPAFAALSQPELLEPEKAFRLAVKSVDDRTVEVRFRIANGYYMYRDRFKFETQDGRLLAEAQLPAGVWKKDPFFGETQTYRREVRIRVPVSPQDMQHGRLDLKVTSQGCADIGVCYAPLEQLVPVRLPRSGETLNSFAWSNVASRTPSPWAQALIAALALGAFAFSLRWVPALKGWRAAARAARWPYPTLAFAIAALLLVAAAPVLGEQPVKFAWGSLLVIGGIWLRALDPLPHEASSAARLGKALGVFALVSGAILMVLALGVRTLISPDTAPPSSGGASASRIESLSDRQELEAPLGGASADATGL